jgi:hypothetical protein
MFRFLLLWLGAILRVFRSRRDLLVESLALRQQLSVFKRRNRRPKLAVRDKLFWVLARGFWSGWKKSASCRISTLLDLDLEGEKNRSVEKDYRRKFGS